MTDIKVRKVSRTLRLGAVGYLNARPLTWSLHRSPDRWVVRYDIPSICARLLHEGQVDLGLIPSIDYLLRVDYRLVPGVGIGSRGPIASVALYTSKPMHDVRTLALDTSSRTSVALVKVLCARRFRIDPIFVPHEPDLAAMMRACDAGLLIGDPAFDADHEALGLQKIDLGTEWDAMTGLPFVYAAWTGGSEAAGPEDIEALQQVQAEGLRDIDAIAREYAHGDEAASRRAAVYLRDNVRYGFGPEETVGLQLFLDYAADLGFGPRRAVAFY